MFLPRLFFSFIALSLTTFAAPTKIACIGDSITEGAGLGNASLESYPARLQRLLGTNNFTVRNFGVSGRTLLKKGDFPYWKEAAFTNSQNFGPDIVIIQLGTNDGKPYNWKYGTNFVSDYKDMISTYAALPSAPRIFLCTPCTAFRTGAFDINPGTVRTNIVPAVRALVTELALPLIDLHTRLTNSTWFPDNIHPNSKGAAAMAAVMYENLFGPPNGTPRVAAERIAPNRFVLSWPQAWGNLVPQSTLSLRGTNTSWSVVETSPPVGDGTTIRHTNTIAGAARLFQLRQP
jgi:lysophospholipase L1-like esterase